MARGWQSQKLQRELSLAHGEPSTAESSPALSRLPWSQALVRASLPLPDLPFPGLIHPSPCSLRPQDQTVPAPDVLLGCALGLSGTGGNQSLCTEALVLSSPLLVREIASTPDLTPKPQTFWKLH